MPESLTLEEADCIQFSLHSELYEGLRIPISPVASVL